MPEEKNPVSCIQHPFLPYLCTMQKGKILPFSITALLRLTRFWNLVIIGLAQYFTAFFLVGSHTATDWHLFVLSVSTIIIAAAGYVINDYYDVKIDLINKPERVVVGQSITRRYAILFHTFLSFTGVALGFLLSWKIAAINFLAAFVLWLYSNNLKRQPFIGNLTVAALTGFSIALINWLYKTDYVIVNVYAAFAFFMTLVREIIKDMEDLKGDVTYGCKTLPIVLGIRKTKIILYFLLMSFITVVLLIHLTSTLLPIYYFVIFLFIPLLILFIRLLRADTKNDFYNLSTLSKIIMLLGILSMAVV
jgi:4-hydroxybenzoate polyprenyltransferase